MEHIFSPKLEIEHPPEEFRPALFVPPDELGNPSQEDLNFYKFPQRHGWLVKKGGEYLVRTCDGSHPQGSGSFSGASVAGGPAIPCTEDECFRRGSPAEITQFCQRWLFFEVLRQFFGADGGRFRYSDFYVTDHIKTWVTTKRLNEYLDAWRAKELNARDESARRDRIIRIQGVLKHAREIVLNFCSADAKIPSKWPVNHNVTLSIMVLGEALAGALVNVRNSIPLVDHGWFDPEYTYNGWGYSDAVLKYLRDKSWCRRTVHMLKVLLQNNTIGLVLCHSYATEQYLHARCTSQECFARQTRSKVERKKAHLRNTPRQNLMNQRLPPVEPRHTETMECPLTNRSQDYDLESQDGSGSEIIQEDCPDIRPNLSRVKAIIGSRRVPLFYYNWSEDAIEIHEFSPKSLAETEYTVFSHVWADGFGNMHENKIFKCVAVMLARLCEDVMAVGDSDSQNGSKKRVAYFWIDTLGLPAGHGNQQIRNDAITRIHDIYKFATYTIVLDRHLMKGQLSTYNTAAIRISLSPWMTRLWTLQEAVLSENVYFNFADDLYALKTIESRLEHEDETVHQSLSNVSRTYYKALLGDERKMFRETKQQDGKLPVANPNLVASVWRAVQWRTLTKYKDETLGLAILLGLDTQPFYDFGPSDPDLEMEDPELNKRMEKFLELLANCKSSDGGSTLCGIPAGMIFLSGAKLRRQGYRWSTRTWLSGQAMTTPDPLTYQWASTKLILEGPCRGLEVTFPGFLLHKLSRFEPNVTAEKTYFHFPIGQNLHEWYKVELADESDRSLNIDDGHQNLGLAIITMQNTSAERPETALLVKINRKIFFRDGEMNGATSRQSSDRNVARFDVEILNRILLSQEREMGVIENFQTMFMESQRDKFWSGERIDLRRWLVDGPADRPAPLAESQQTGPSKRSGSDVTGTARKMTRTDQDAKSLRRWTTS